MTDSFIKQKTSPAERQRIRRGCFFVSEADAAETGPPQGRIPYDRILF